MTYQKVVKSLAKV